jgi:hypothetical protein
VQLPSLTSKIEHPVANDPSQQLLVLEAEIGMGYCHRKRRRKRYLNVEKFERLSKKQLRAKENELFAAAGESGE